MSGRGGGNDFSKEMEVAGRWPFKYLWNTIQGKSIVADDEVLLTELKVTYPSLSRVLLLFKKSNGESTERPSTSAYGTFITQVANSLDVDESIAKRIFASYVMFEHQGGTISLTADRVTLMKHVGHIKTFYLQERMCLLLSIQALFSGACDPDHQYKAVIKDFTDWIVKTSSMKDVIRNLVASIPLCLSVEEELNTMFALTHCLYFDPYKTVQPFLELYKSFNSSPERKDSLVSVAEGGLFFAALLLPISEEDDGDEDFMDSLRPITESRKDFIRNRLEEPFVSNNGFIIPAVIAARYVLEGPSAEDSITSPFWVYSARIDRLVEFYLKNRSFKRHSVSTIVLQCVYKAMETSYACCPFDIPQAHAPTFHNLMTHLIANVDGNFRRFLSGNPEIQNVYLEATLKFPAILDPLMELWSAIAKSLGKSAEIDEMLSYLGSELSTVAELSAEPLVQGRSETIGYVHNQDQTVATVRVPAGSEIVYFEQLGEKSFLTSWDLKQKLPYSPWRVIAEHIVLPLYKTVTGGMPLSTSDMWSDSLIKTNFLSVVQFLITFSETSEECSDVCQLKLYFHCVTVLVRAMDLTRDISEQSLFGGYVVRLTMGSIKLRSDFRPIATWGREYLSKIFPSTPETQNLVATVVMGIESLGSSGFYVTDAFLDAIIYFLDGGNLERTLRCDILNIALCRSVLFMNDNVFHAFTRWRRMSQEKRHELLLKCLRVYNAVFNVDNNQFLPWNEAKQDCARSLLAPNSSLMVILSTEESFLTESVVNPTDVTSYLPPIIYQSLSLLLKLFHYQKDAIQLVDEFLGKTLVKKLATFAQHRLDYKIPTLAMAVLKRIAEELNMSLLSCLGRQDTEFRDLLLQRLEFKCEDVNLKVGILEFLAIAAHSQAGLIQFVFMDPVLAQKIVDLPTEKDDNLSISVLVFMRAMIHSGVTVLKKCDNLWSNIFCPLKNSSRPISNFKMVTCFLHICTFEIFHNGLSEESFLKVLKAFLDPEFCDEIILDGFSRSGVEIENFLVSLKQFLRVMHMRNKYSGPIDPVFPEKTKLAILQYSTKAFFEIKDSGAEAGNVKSGTDNSDTLRCSLAEVMCQLVHQTTFESDYLDVLMGWLARNFAEDKVAVQIPVLYLVRGCIEVRPQPNPISDSTLENTLRVVVSSLDRTEKILDHPSFPIPVAIITQSLNILIAIQKRGSSVCPKWDSMFKQYSVAAIVSSIVRSTISRRKAPDVALQAMYLLNKLAEETDGLFLCNIPISDLIWYPLVVFARPESHPDPGWEQVYVLGLELTATLLRHQRYFFLEDVLNFWGIHGAYLSHKLWSLSEMTKTCVMNDPEKNYTNMRSLLNFNVFVLSTVTAMLPFHEEWRRQQPNEFTRILEGSFTALNTAINLLNQPGYLQVVITLGRNSIPKLASDRNGSQLSLEQCMSPQLLDLQNRLWEVIFLCTSILFKVRLYSGVFLKSDTVMGTINQVVSTSLKGLSKSHSSSSQQASTNAASSLISLRIVPTLERAVLLFLFHAKKILENPGLAGRRYNIASREIATDVNTIVDGVKRLSGPKNAYLVAMCEALEKEFASSFSVSRPSRSTSTGVMDES